jgi:protocatechuate 3,4-dioxygenase, beta subunit
MADNLEYAREDPGQPPSLSPAYGSTVARSPRQPLVRIPQTVTETTGPADWGRLMGGSLADLTRQHSGEPHGQRIVVSGRVLDESHRPVGGAVIEIWQANAAGRYAHPGDQHDAPLDPNFPGGGRVFTDADGWYQFTTIKPGAYPWRNHHNAWRPAHIHFSLFGTAFTQRLVTQMYFPGDPLFELDPIFSSILDPAARGRLVARYDHDLTEPEYATGYRWDIVLAGGAGTPAEGEYD